VKWTWVLTGWWLTGSSVNVPKPLSIYSVNLVREGAESNRLRMARYVVGVSGSCSASMIRGLVVGGHSAGRKYTAGKSEGPGKALYVVWWCGYVCSAHATPESGPEQGQASGSGRDGGARCNASQCPLNRSPALSSQSSHRHTLETPHINLHLPELQVAKSDQYIPPSSCAPTLVMSAPQTVNAAGCKLYAFRCKRRPDRSLTLLNPEPDRIGWWSPER
jgi:hypothetical protein